MHLEGTDNSPLPVFPAKPVSRLRAVSRAQFFLVTIFCVAIPGFASIKAVLIVLLWAAIALTSELRLRTVFWFLSVVLGLVFCGEIALLHSVAIADFLNHLSRLFLFFLVLGIGAYMARSQTFHLPNIDSLILVVATIAAGLKIAILAAIASGMATFDSVQNALGFESVTDSIGFGLQRLQFPSDILLIFLLVCYSGRRKLLDMLFLLSATASIFLSFSRYLFVAYMLCLLIRCLRIRRLDLISGAALGLSLVLIAIFSVSLTGRFRSEGSKVSDTIRTEQSRYLLAAISERPLLGSGIGSSVNGYKRSETIPFSYEVEWYAMAMQLGFIGLSWFLLNLAAPLLHCIQSTRGRVMLGAVLAVWVIGGFTNPFLVSLGSAFGLSILMMTLAAQERSVAMQSALLQPPQL